MRYTIRGCIVTRDRKHRQNIACANVYAKRILHFGNSIEITVYESDKVQINQ